MLVYQNSRNTLELTGKSGEGNFISLTGFSSKGQIKKGNSLSQKAPIIQRSEGRANLEKSASFVSPSASSPGNSLASGSANSEEFGSSTGSVGGVGSGHGIGAESAGMGEHDYLFPHIKSFFENRLGSTLNIRERQSIKIKVSLSNDGEILDALLIQGKLEGSILRRVLSVAKNIPLKNYWKSGSYPKELIIPLVLTPQ